MSASRFESGSDFSETELALIDFLRSQAEHYRDCFSYYFNRGLALLGVILVLLLKFQPDAPMLGLVGVFVVFGALAIGKIAIEKHEVANRNEAYELNLERVKRLHNSSVWDPSYRSVGWRESERAWQVLFGTLYENIYVVGRQRCFYAFLYRLSAIWGLHWMRLLIPVSKHIDMDRLGTTEVAQRIGYRWFEPASLLVPGASYRVGAQPKVALRILTSVVLCGLLPIYGMAFQLSLQAGNASYYGYTVFLLAAGLTFYSFMRIDQLNMKRRQLERGLTSVSASSVVWQIVITAHHRALKSLDSGYRCGHVDTLNGYLTALSQQAVEVGMALYQEGGVFAWLNRNWTGSSSPEAIAESSCAEWSETHLQGEVTPH